MTIHFNPKIRGGFVEKVLKCPHVKKELMEKGVKPEEAHDLAKCILITGFNTFNVDVNKIINDLNDEIAVGV